MRCKNSPQKVVSPTTETTSATSCRIARHERQVPMKRQFSPCYTEGHEDCWRVFEQQDDGSIKILKPHVSFYEATQDVYGASYYDWLAQNVPGSIVDADPVTE